MTAVPTACAAEPPAVLPRGLVLLLAAGAGLSAASLYYNQPVLEAIARELHASPQAVGLVPMLTQLGYAAGILLFAPLGDRLDRRRVILAKSVALSGALLVAGLSPSIAWLCAASLGVGLFATAAQDFVPAAATLAPPEARGKIVGSVMTGLLLGILLSRLASGAVGASFGWRAVYFGAAGISVGVALVSARFLPRLLPVVRDPYAALLRSLVSLVREHAPLRRAALAQALLSVAFSGFWSTLALVLAGAPFRLGSAVAGAFGIAGAAGALIAPVAGSLADRRGPEPVVRAGAALVAASFAVMALAPGSLAVLAIATITFDLGVQAALIAHQTIVYGLDPAARSRVNAVLVSAMFFGMALGAALAARAYAHFGLVGVALLCAFAAVLGLIVRIVPRRA